MNEPNKPVPLADLNRPKGDALVVDRLDFGGREFPPLESAPVETPSAADLITALQSCFSEIDPRARYAKSPTS